MAFGEGRGSDGDPREGKDWKIPPTLRGPNPVYRSLRVEKASDAPLSVLAVAGGFEMPPRNAG